MGYFSNGSSGEAYREQWCERCWHGQDDDAEEGKCCPVWGLHLDLNGTPGDAQHALDALIPRSKDRLENEQCAMFLPCKLPPGATRP